jgi:hypothetical protein
VEGQLKNLGSDKIQYHPADEYLRNLKKRVWDYYTRDQRTTEDPKNESESPSDSEDRNDEDES